MADDFGTWIGWLLPFNAPIVLVLDPDQDLDEVIVQLDRIGFEQVRGVLRGVASWQAAGYPLATYETVDAARFAQAITDGSAEQVLDVRSPAEWETGSLAGAVWRYVPDLTIGAPAELRQNNPVWVVCASGFRASIAAGLLERLGFRPVVLADGGVARRCAPTAGARRDVSQRRIELVTPWATARGSISHPAVHAAGRGSVNRMSYVAAARGPGPPGDSAHKRPPIASIRARAIVRPMPLPPSARLRDLSTR